MLLERVEVYYDPSGFKGGRSGCFKARLASDHKIWGAGVTETEAEWAFIITAATFGKPNDRSYYSFQFIGERCDNPAGIKEVADVLIGLRGR